MRFRTLHLLPVLVPMCAVAQISFAQQPAAQAPAAPRGPVIREVPNQ